MEPGKLLRIYINDHRAGAVGGASLCRRISEDEKGTPLGDLAAELLVEIDAERQQLERYARENGIACDPVKTLAAAAAELVSRLKLNGLFGRSPLRPVLQVEALMAGVDAKRSLWQALVASDNMEPLDLNAFEQLLAWAKSQHDRLEVQHREVARNVLATS